MTRIALFVFLITVGCIAHAAERSTVRFVAFGDAGAGNGAQFAVAQAMAEVCKARGCDFAIMLGDNFYPDGVHSAEDPQFETKFEAPYDALKFPFYVALGNHDSGADGTHNAYGDFEVAYSSRANRQSKKWQMPARYYTVSKGPVDLFALDSPPLAPYTDDPDPKWNAETYGAAQLAWLQKALADSKAPWKIAFAHHPYISDGGHGSAGHYLVRTPGSKYADGKFYREFLEKSVCAAGVDLMLAGHDHDLEWLKPIAACGNTEFVTSGAGGATLTTFFNNDKPIYWQQSARYGFFWFEVGAEQLKGVAFTLDEENAPQVAFERTLKKKRDSSLRSE